MPESVSQSARFAEAWLSLRETLDHCSRAEPLTRAAAEWLAGRAAPRLVDLGCGSGSNTRYLAPRLPGPQHWRLVDHDPELLAHARFRCQSLRDRNGEPIDLSVHPADLADLDCLALAGPSDLVTASALLDLVSEQWLDSLVLQCRAQGSAILAALSYDGTFSFDQGLPEDDLVRASVNAHQRRDKGFGDSLGPDAAAVFSQMLRARGFIVRTLPSPWQLDHRHAPLQQALIKGWCDAAIEQDPEHQGVIGFWRAQRLAEVRAGQARISVGHQDIFAVPADS